MGYGFPPEHIADKQKIEAAFSHAMNKPREDVNKLFNYGTRKGDYEVIKTLSDWYSKQIKCNINPDNVYTTYGATFAVFFSSQAILKPGDNVLIECPSYFLMANVFNDLGYNLYPARKHMDGTFDYKELEESIVKNNIKAFYLVTNYHNPLGVNLQLKDRCILYEMAHRLKVYLISDDLYELLYFNEETRQIPIFFCDEKVKNGDTSHLSTFNNDSSPYIISVNSLNKAICPSIRFGFIYAHSSVIDKIHKNGIICSGNGLNSMSNYIVASFIELGYLNERLECQRQFLSKNKEVAYEVLKTSPFFEFQIPEGGYFYFLVLNKNVDIDRLNALKSKYDISFVNGFDIIPDKFKGEFSEFKHTVRLSISYLPENLIKEACEAFVKMVAEAVIV